jgi:hypothetical protein
MSSERASYIMSVGMGRILIDDLSINGYWVVFNFVYV